METARRLPRPIPQPGDILARPPGRMERNDPSVTDDGVPLVDRSGEVDLQPLDGGVDIPRRPAAPGLFAQDVPRLDRGSELHRNVVIRDVADVRAAELVVRREPVLLELVTERPQVGQDVLEVLLEEVGEHEPVVEGGPPADRLLDVWLLPEHRHERTDKKLLRQAHLRMRRHLEAAELNEPQTPRGVVRRIELVDADLGPVRVAGDVDQEVPEDPVDEPRRRVNVGPDLVERDLEFVEGVLPPFVDAARWLVGPMNWLEKRYEREGWLFQYATMLRSTSGRRRNGLSAGLGPPRTTWFPPPVPVCLPSSWNFSVPRRV